MANPESATVLVVDDEPDIRTLCRVNLEYEGYRVLEAADGFEALELAKSEKPNLVLLDLMMPRMDGWEVLELLQKDEELAGIRVVLLTAVADDEAQLKGWMGGVLDYVTKPFNPLSLSKYVAEALEYKDPLDQAKKRQQVIEKLERLRDIRRKSEEDGT